MHDFRRSAPWSALLMTAGLALASPSAHATVIGQAETHVIVGKVIADVCEEAWGPAYEEVLDSKNKLTGCACKFGWDDVCGAGGGFSWNDDDWTPPDNGGGSSGGDRGGDDECADDDEICICQAEEPEPELCELSCSECGRAGNECEAKTDLAYDSCQTKNEKTAAYLCSKDSHSFYADTASCVYGKLNGFPGLSSGSYKGSTSGWTVGGDGGVEFNIGVVKVDLGGEASHTWGSSKGSSLTVSYPPVPVDYSVFGNCQKDAGIAYMECLAGQETCNSSVEEQTGESCSEEMSEPSEKESSDARAPSAQSDAKTSSALRKI